MWLDPARTSPFRFYQFWLNDRRSRRRCRTCKWFTFLDGGRDRGDRRPRTPRRRRSARRSASWRAIVTRVVHGDGELARAERASRVLFGGALADADPDDILMVFDDVPSIELPAHRLRWRRPGRRPTLAVQAGLIASKGEANRLIKQGGLYVNDRRLAETDNRLTACRPDRWAGAGATEGPARAPGGPAAPLRLSGSRICTKIRATVFRRRLTAGNGAVYDCRFRA